MSGGVSLVSFCHIYVRMRTLWISPFLKEAAEMSLCLSPRLTLYQFMKLQLKPEVLKRQQIDGVLKNWWESGTIAPQKKKEEANQSAYLKRKKKNCHYKNNQGGFPLLLWQKGTCSQWFSLLRNRCFCLEGAPNNFPVRFGSWVLSSFLSFFNAIVLFSCKIVLVGGGENSPENVIIKYGEFLTSVLAGKNVTYASLIWKGMQDGLLGQISLSDEL